MSESDSMPSGWTETRLGDVAAVLRGVTYRRGQAADEPDDGLVPLLRSGNIGKELILNERLVFVPAELVRDDQRLRRGDIVVSTSNSRDLVGKSAVLRHAWGGTFGAFCSVVRPDSDAVDPEYLGLFLQSPAYRFAIAKLSAATNNIANIRAGHLLDMPLSLPPMDEQRAIVEAIARLRARSERGITGLTRALNALTQFRASCLASAFNGTSSGAASFEVVPLDEVARVQSGLAKGRAPDDATFELPYIRTANVQAGFLDLSIMKTLAVTEQQCSKHRLQHNDVLVLEGGDADKVGRGWLWESQIDECLHQNHVFAVRTGAPLLPRFLAHFVNAPQARSYFLRCAKQTTNLASINKGQLKALPVPLPPLTEQLALVEMLDRQLDAARLHEGTLRAQLAAAGTLDATLLHHALTGRLVRPTDNTARAMRDGDTQHPRQSAALAGS